MGKLRARSSLARMGQAPRALVTPGRLEQRDNSLGAGVVEAILVDDARRSGQLLSDALPRLPRAVGSRHQSQVGNERVPRHISPDHRGIALAARIEPARMIAHAAFG